MKSRHTATLISLASAFTATGIHAADLFWDANSTSGNGDGNSTYAGGTWNTTSTNWDRSAALTRVAWNNANLDNAVFSGTYTTGIKTITIGANVTVNQIRVLTGSTGGNRYDFGASATQNDYAITFGGSYDAETPALTGNANFVNTNFNAKITGNVAGGLVLNHGSIASNPASGRFAFTNANNDFIGNVILTSGNLLANNNLGNAANKLVLQGGSLFVSGSTATTTTFSRAIEVSSDSGINTNAATAGLQILDLTGPISGSANLTRYAAANASATSELRLSGDMSSFTGLFEARASGTSVTNLVIQTTAQSAGQWKLSGGITRLNTADDTHIANGQGKGNLLMNGGTLDMNGKNETINGLDGDNGTVRNSLAESTSTLTLGDGDASATFGGNLTNGSGVLAIHKIGAGIQTLSGTSTHTGETTVSAGTLLVSGKLGNTPVTIHAGAAIGGGGILDGMLHFNADAKLVFNPGTTLTVNGLSVSFAAFGIPNLAGLTSATADGEYPLIDGSAIVNTANLGHVGIENAYSLGANKYAYFETGSLKVHVIPEPAAALLASLGLLPLFRRRRS